MKKLLIFLFSLFLLSTVAALDFDNVKTYDSIAKEITIKNAFGLPFIGDDLAVYKLDYNTDQCLINCYAEGKVTLYTDGYLFNKLEFKNRKGDHINLPTGKIFIQDFIDYTFQEVDEIKEICENIVIISNLTKETTNEKICHNETIYKEVTGKKKDWVEYDGQVLGKGSYLWKIEGIKNIDEDIDWIGNSFGESLNEWAWWNNDWNYKKEIKVQDNAGSTISNYTLDLIINKSVNMNSDYSDLRFINAAENSELGYWIYFANSTEARIKVRIEDNLVANNNVSIYMYYGNALASSTSDIANANMVGEDGADFSEWTENDPGGRLTLNTTSKRLEWSGLQRGDTAQVYRQFNNLTNYSVEFVYDSISAVNWVGLSAIADTTNSFFPTGNKIQWVGHHSAGVMTTREKYSEPNDYGTGGNLQALGGGDYSVSTGVNYYIVMSRNGTTMNWKVYLNQKRDVLVGSSTSVYNSAVGDMIFAFLINNIDDTDTTGGSNGWLTNYTISKYIFPFPTYSIGQEENAGSLAAILNSPEDSYSSSNYSVTFNYSATDDVGVLNLTLIIDGVDNYTIFNTSANQNLSNVITLNFADGFHNWTARASDGVENDKTAALRTFEINTTPFIVFNTPPTLVDFANSTLGYVPMSVNVTTFYFKNITYSLRNINGTNYTQTFTNETYNINFTDVATAHYHYDVTVCTTTNQCNKTETRHINHDVTSPEIIINSPNETFNYLYEGISLDLNWTITDEGEGVDSCWYEYNGVNTSLTCGNNHTTFNYSEDINNLTFYSNDTFGNFASNFTSWNYKIFEINKTYNNATAVGTFEEFDLFLKEGSGASVQSVVLYYYGQTDSSSLYFSGSQVKAVSDFVISGIESDTNVSFYFQITLDDSTVINTTNATQFVATINIDDCSVQPNLFLTLNLLDEGNQSAINGTIEVYLALINSINYQEILNFNGSYSGVNTKSFCSDLLLNATDFLLGAEIKYDEENHSAEFYNIQRSPLSSYPQNYNLYDLKDEDTTRFKVLYQGQDLVGVSGAIMQLQRKYISEGVYKIVEAPLTSSDSKAILHIDTNTNLYKVTVVKDGVLLNTFDNLAFICQSELTGECTLDLIDFIVPPNSVDIEQRDDFVFTPTTSIDDKTITLDYSVPSGTNALVRVVAIQTDIIGTEVICNTSVLSAAGSIECTYEDSIDDSFIDYYVYKNGKLVGQRSYVVQEDLRDDFAGANYFMLVVFAISLIAMAFTSPEWIIINAIISILIGGAVWLVRGMDFVLGLGAIAWLILGAIIIIKKLSEQEDR